MLTKIKKNKNRIKKIKDTGFLLFLALVFFGIIGFVLVSNINIDNERGKYLKKISELKEEIKKAEERKKDLEKNLSEAGKSLYLEEIARNQFGLKAPGEEVVVVTKDAKTTPTPSPSPIPTKSSWWNIFK